MLIVMLVCRSGDDQLQLLCMLCAQWFVPQFEPASGTPTRRNSRRD